MIRMKKKWYIYIYILLMQTNTQSLIDSKMRKIFKNTYMDPDVVCTTGISSGAAPRIRGI